MSERITDERLVELKRVARPRGITQHEAEELFAELNALRAERDEAITSIPQLIRNERASAAVVVEGLVEYVRHKNDCGAVAGSICNCGLEESQSAADDLLKGTAQ